MIRIQVTWREDGVDIQTVGHAGYAPRGTDVVCAGISALLYGFVAYLETLSSVATAKESAGSGKAFHWEAVEGDGVLWVRTRGEARRVFQGFAAIRAGIGLIAETYPQLVVLEDSISQKGDEYEST